MLGTASIINDLYIFDCYKCRSFGVLLWEIMSRGAFPYASLSDEEVANAVFHHNNKLPQPKDCPDRVYDLY